MTHRSATARTPRAPTRKPAAPEFHARRALIAEAAYFRAKRRGFEPGHELEDWLAAELDIERALSGASH
jgi:hypothetical protein